MSRKYTSISKKYMRPWRATTVSGVGISIEPTLEARTRYATVPAHWTKAHPFAKNIMMNGRRCPWETVIEMVPRKFARKNPIVKRL